LELLLYQSTKWGLEDTTLRILNLIELIVFEVLNCDKKEIANSWAEFESLVQKSGLMQRFVHKQAIESKIYEICEKIKKIMNAREKPDYMLMNY
jgi:hypothetical protein